MTQPTGRIQPLRAWRAMRALIADREDTAQVFNIIDALRGRSLQKTLSRLRHTPGGAELIARKPDLTTVVGDYRRFANLPEATLGKAYYHFMQAENLDLKALGSASRALDRSDETTPELAWLGNWIRDSHDLWHVLTGYGRDVLGELCLFAYGYAQRGNPGIGFIVLMGTPALARQRPGEPIVQAVWEAYRLGRRARWIPALDWEEWLERPLVDLRRAFAVTPPRIYGRLCDGDRRAAGAADQAARTSGW